MSRELQDVDLAEVKPLVEKGEVSGAASYLLHLVLVVDTHIHGIHSHSYEYTFIVHSMHTCE